MSARLAAAELIHGVMERGRSLDAAMAEAAAFAPLAGSDRAFARAIAGAALRRLGGLDAAAARFLARPLPDQAGEARAVLRAGLAELLVLGGAPHAAVSEAVAAAQVCAPRFAGLVNAVLRRAAEAGPALLADAASGADLPAWLFARWRAAHGGERAAALAAAVAAGPPPLDLTVKAGAAAWAETLSGTLLATGSVRLAPGHAPVARLPGYEEGAWWVQDAAAALPAQLLGDIAGRRVLDLCAAPGGKTLQLAAAGARVTALDSDAGRLDRVAENLARTGLAAEIVAADARTWRPDQPFDAVLLDAPCTATGTLRRRPDAAWLRRPDDIPALAALQRDLLAAAAGCLASGGRLVYAVCSLEPEEGEAILAHAPACGLIHEPLSPGERPALAPWITPEGALRTWPSDLAELGGMDGFFAARFSKA